VSRSLARAIVVGGLAALPTTQGFAADVDGPFGVYPNCIAPGTPIEVHSWWAEPDEAIPRHLHMSACLPNARDTSGELVSISRPQRFTTQIKLFNAPGVVNLARWAWESDVQEVVRTNFECQERPMERRECEWEVDMTLDPDSASSGGLHEIRLTPNIGENDLGKRQYASLNYQIYLDNGKSPNNYRSRTDPIARSWYTDFDYANVAVNYMDFFRGEADLNKTVPTVSGVVPLRIQHQKGSHTQRSQLWLDPDFHHSPEDFDNAVVGRPNPSGSVLLYDHAGRFNGTYDWDTRGLANGRHALYFQTVDEGDTGLHAAAMRLFFDVRNPDGPPGPDPDPDPDPHPHPDPNDPGPGPDPDPGPPPTEPPADPELEHALEDIRDLSDEALDGDRDPEAALRSIYDAAREALGL
jgi:hypothetical protein